MSYTHTTDIVIPCQYQTFSISKEIFDEYKSPDGALRFLYKITHKETGLVYVGRKTAHTYKSAIEYKGSSQHDLFKNIKNQDISLYEWEIVNYLPEGIILKYEDGTLEDFEEDLILKTKSQYGSKCVNQHSNNHWFLVKPYERTEEHKKQMSFRLKESVEKGIKVSWNKSKYLSEEDKEKKRISANKIEVKERQRQARLGRKWCSNGVEELWLLEEEFNLRLKEGWKKGRLKSYFKESVQQKDKKKSKLQESMARLESKKKRSKIAKEQYANKSMIDLSGNLVKVHTDGILSKLKDGWTLKLKKIYLYHPIAREESITNLTRKYGHKNLMSLLEQGWLFGKLPLEYREEAIREYGECCEKRER